MNKAVQIMAAAPLAATVIATPTARAQHTLSDPAVIHGGIEEHATNIAISSLGEPTKCLNFHRKNYQC